MRLIFASIERAFFRAGSQGILVAVAVLAGLALFIVPIHSSVLDICLVVNLTIAISLLIRSLLVSDPIRLFSFPSILLLATLFRLALNVSSTRLILLYGDSGLSAAGQVIRSFGSFVIQGDFVVGIIIFLLISVVNFLVIAKGSSRVAEVAARFVLDAMPGKQLAIDADLRSGIITPLEAEAKRAELSRVSQFYGAMDGAMKFVQGDAIAGLVITSINAIGGISIGISRGLSISDAVTTFGVLTVGDGLVSIIPALLISVCAGIVITHVSGEDKKGSSAEIFSQIVEEPTALIIAAISLICVGLVPGFPFLPFFAIGGLILISIYFSRKSNTGAVAYQTKAELVSIDKAEKLVEIPFRVLALELSSKSFKEHLADENSSMSLDFKNFIQSLWTTTKAQLGVDLPKLSISFNDSFEDNFFVIRLREEIVYKNSLATNMIFVVLSPVQLRSLGCEVQSSELHPLTGQLSSWVEDNSKNNDLIRELEIQSYSSLEYLGLTLAAIGIDSSDLIYGLDEIKSTIVASLRSYPALREEIFDRGVLSYAECADCFKKLISERVSIRDIKLILETIADYCARYETLESRTEWLSELYEFVREKIQKASSYSSSACVFKVTEPVVDSFRSAISLWDVGRGFPPLKDSEREQLRKQMEEVFQPISERGIRECFLICPADIRFGLHSYLKAFFPQYKQLKVLSDQEIRFADGLSIVGVI